ncbi:MAG TPA: hypothetical protein VKG43_14380 [Acidimicrobiales bacterium]|nr:hypothetical protein [Acidimicrobiales bacterium]
MIHPHGVDDEVGVGVVVVVVGLEELVDAAVDDVDAGADVVVGASVVVVVGGSVVVVGGSVVVVVGGVVVVVVGTSLELVDAAAASELAVGELVAVDAELAAVVGSELVDAELAVVRVVEVLRLGWVLPEPLQAARNRPPARSRGQSRRAVRRGVLG